MPLYQPINCILLPATRSLRVHASQLTSPPPLHPSCLTDQQDRNKKKIQFIAGKKGGKLTSSTCEHSLPVGLLEGCSRLPSCCSHFFKHCLTVSGINPQPCHRPSTYPPLRWSSTARSTARLPRRTRTGQGAFARALMARTCRFLLAPYWHPTTVKSPKYAHRFNKAENSQFKFLEAKQNLIRYSGTGYRSDNFEKRVCK